MTILPEESTYLPVLFVNDFWLLREHLIEVNSTLQKLPLTLSFAPVSLMKWQIFVQMEQSFQVKLYSFM